MKPSEGYSSELVSNRVDQQFYDNLEGQPSQQYGARTLLELFKNNVSEFNKKPFLGTRPFLKNDNDGKPVYGEY